MVTERAFTLFNQESNSREMSRTNTFRTRSGNQDESITHDSALILTCLRALNLSTRLFGTTLTDPSGISPIILAGDPETMENGGITMSGGMVVPASTTTKSFKIHLKTSTEIDQSRKWSKISRS
jgi:hypothetical protein